MYLIRVHQRWSYQMNRVTASYTLPTGARITSTFDSWSNDLHSQYINAANVLEKEHDVKVDVNKVAIQVR